MYNNGSHLMISGCFISVLCIKMEQRHSWIKSGGRDEPIWQKHRICFICGEEYQTAASAVRWSRGYIGGLCRGQWGALPPRWVFLWSALASSGFIWKVELKDTELLWKKVIKTLEAQSFHVLVLVFSCREKLPVTVAIIGFKVFHGIIYIKEIKALIMMNIVNGKDIVSVWHLKLTLFSDEQNTGFVRFALWHKQLILEHFFYVSVFAYMRQKYQSFNGNICSIYWTVAVC